MEQINAKNIDSKIQCLECKSLFSNNCNLRRHVLKFHPDKKTELAPFRYKTKEGFKFPCTICTKNFNHEKNMKQHMRIHHGTRTSKQTRKQMKCPLCEYQNFSKINLISHFKEVHEVVICEKNIELIDADFQEWKSDLERSTNTKFIIEYVKQSKNMVTESYVCHRSGSYIQKGKGLRNLKTQGSNKINAFCPSSIKVRREKFGDKCYVQFIETHVGHKNDIGHLCLTESEREALAQKIAAKVPFNKILDDIRDSVSHSTLQRIHFLTKKDLYNIESSFNLCSSSVNEVRKNTAQKNTTSMEHPELKSEYEDINQLQIDMPKNDESSVIIMKVSKNNFPQSSLALQEEKEKLKSYFIKLVDDVTSPSKLEIIKKMVASISSATGCHK